MGSNSADSNALKGDFLLTVPPEPRNTLNSNAVRPAHTERVPVELLRPPVPSSPLLVRENVAHEDEEMNADVDGPQRCPECSHWRVVVVFCFTSFIVCNLDRINFSVASIPMAEEFGWSESRKGIAQAAFFCGYMTTQIPGGIAADRYGGRVVLAAGVAAWSFMTLLTPFAARESFPSLIVVRILLGVGEGVAMPAMNALVKQWVPDVSVSSALAYIYSGMYMGSILGLVISPALITGYDWPAVFVVSGVVGVVWVVAFLFVVAKSPSLDVANVVSPFVLQAHPKESTAYKSVPQQALQPFDQESRNSNPALSALSSSAGRQCKEEEAASVEIPTLRKILSVRAVWAINVAHFCTTWGYFVLLSWLPTYFSSFFGLNISQSSLLAALPWITMFVGANLAGMIAENLIRKNLGLTRTRKVLQLISFIGPSICLGILIRVTQVTTAVALVALALGFSSFAQGGVYCNHQDIAGDAPCAGVLLGISNSFASVPGIVGVGVTGFILDKTDGSWSAVFALAIGFYLLGSVVYLSWASSDRLFM